MAQTLVHGARVLEIEGNFDVALDVARALAERYPVALVNSVNPFRLQGQKTAAFEICDALGTAPDYHITPVGNAGNITSHWMGYTQYRSVGVTTALPVLFGFQPAGGSAHRPRPARQGTLHDRHCHPDRQSGVMGTRGEGGGRLGRRDSGRHRPGDPGCLPSSCR
jgi:threonine synthase